MYWNEYSQLNLCVVACVIHIALVTSQCTTKHCYDDNEYGVGALTVFVSRLQDTVDQQHELLEQQQKHIEELRQLLNSSIEEQQKQLTLLNKTLMKQGELLDKYKQSSVQAADDCAEHLKNGHSTSGVYNVRLANKIIQVYCDMTTDGGGWLVFQRRVDNTTDFYRDWKSYKEGFGDITRNFWLGNDNLHALTAKKESSLRIDLGDFEGATVYCAYSSFAIADEEHQYKLSLGSSHGTTSGYHFVAHSNGMGFTTKDRDNDDYSSGNCAQDGKGAWWYYHCGPTNLNGQYLGGANSTFYEGINWYPWHDGHYSLKMAEMKLRPR